MGSEMATTTPVPWRLRENREAMQMEIYGEPACASVQGEWELARLEYDGVEEVEDEFAANARLIVRAVNSFAAMREALQTIQPLLEHYAKEGGPDVSAQYCLDKLRAALALADKEGE